MSPFKVFFIVFSSNILWCILTWISCILGRYSFISYSSFFCHLVYVFYQIGNVSSDHFIDYLAVLPSYSIFLAIDPVFNYFSLSFISFLLSTFLSLLSFSLSFCFFPFYFPFFISSSISSPSFSLNFFLSSFSSPLCLFALSFSLSPSPPLFLSPFLQFSISLSQHMTFYRTVADLILGITLDLPWIQLPASASQVLRLQVYITLFR